MNFILCWYFRAEICGELGSDWRRGGTKQQQKGVSWWWSSWCRDDVSGGISGLTCSRGSHGTFFIATNSWGRLSTPLYVSLPGEGQKNASGLHLWIFILVFLCVLCLVLHYWGNGCRHIYVWYCVWVAHLCNGNSGLKTKILGWVIMYLSPPTVGSWWSQWGVMAAHSHGLYVSVSGVYMCVKVPVCVWAYICHFFVEETSLQWTRDQKPS